MRKYYPVRDGFFLAMTLALGLVIPAAFCQLNLTPAMIWGVTMIFVCSFGRPAGSCNRALL